MLANACPATFSHQNNGASATVVVVAVVVVVVEVVLVVFVGVYEATGSVVE